MHVVKRAMRVMMVGLAVLAAPALARAETPLAKILPGSTLAYLQVENASQFRDALAQSQYGKLLSDPALKGIKDDILKKIEEANQESRGKLGMSIEEILTIPQGAVTAALLPSSDNPEVPVALVIAADAGANADKMASLMDKLTSMAKEDGKAKVTSEEFKGLNLTSIQGGGEKERPMTWVRTGTVFHIASEISALKELLANADGREDSLAALASFQKVKEKGGADAQLVWFLNIEELFRTIGKAMEARGGGNADQIQAQLQLTGLSGIKAAGGGVAMNVGQYDTISRAFLYAPGEAQGLARIFSMPKADLKPEAWVPQNVASYQSISWDLDDAYKAINDLAETFAPGVLAAMEQNLAGGQGEGLKFERDLFGPLGDRITIISDFKKPVTEKSQRMLVGVSLEDDKAFQATWNKLLDIAKATPKQRDFQGVTIYDFEIPEMANAPGGGNVKVELNGPISICVSKGQLFLATDTTLLEQVLRGGSPALGDSAEFRSIAAMLPAQSSTLTFERPEEQARLVYDMIKNGQLSDAIEEGAKAGGGDADVDVPELIDPKKLPDFEVFAKYLTLGGGYGLTDPEGMTFTRFTLKKSGD